MTSAGIIGLGLMGGSIAKALRNKAGFSAIAAFDLDIAPLSQAKSEGVIDNYSVNDFSIFSSCDIIFICSHVTTIPSFLEKLNAGIQNGVIKKECIITDVGSTKKSIVEKSEEYENMQFVGGHPMAGSEKSGYASSNDFLFENAYYIIAPSKNASNESVNKFTNLVSSILAIPVVIEAHEHDRITSIISHTPHLVAAALVNLARRSDDEGKTIRSLAAGGFRDITRIASSDSRLWQSISFENREDILKTLDAFLNELGEVRKYLIDGNETELGGYLRLAKNYRDDMPASSRSKYVETFELSTDVIDKPGSIAIISTLLGVNGVNIKNIGIANNREYKGGILQISFGSEADMLKGEELLKSMRFTVYKNG